MLEIIWKAATALPALVQAVLGSAVFWLLVNLLSIATTATRQGLADVSSVTRQESALREYNHLRYKGMSGLVNTIQGFCFGFERSGRYLLQGLMFMTIGSIAGTFIPVLSIVAMLGSLWYLRKSYWWLTTPYTGLRSQPWQRIADLEVELSGAIDPATSTRLAAGATSTNAPAEPAQ